MAWVYTKTRLPVVLVWSLETDNEDAWVLERRLHGWGRAKREALIRGEFERLPGLSKSKRAGDGGRTTQGPTGRTLTVHETGRPPE